MKEFIKSLLLENGFNESYVDSLLVDSLFLTKDDELLFNKNKRKATWRTILFGRLGSKGFNKQSRDYWVFRGYSDVESRDKAKNNAITRRDPTPMQKEFWVKKGMSVEEAIFKIKSFRKTQTEYWTSRGYSDEEAIEKIRNYQMINSEKLKQKIINKPELFADVFQNQKKYWLKKGFSEEDATKKVSEIQTTFSLEKCIDKYGEDEGRKRWLNRQEKWNKNYKKTNYSKISQELFWKIMGELDFSKNKIFFATYDNGKKSDGSINMEYTITCKNMSLKPDFLLLDNMKIIEFDGIYWHDHKRRNKPENEKREIRRQTELSNMGYTVLRIR
jgi:hypothetical protein